MSFKDWVGEWAGVDEYERRYEKLDEKHKALQEQYAALMAQYDNEVQVNHSMANKVVEVTNQLDQVIAKYEPLLSDPKRYNAEQERYIDQLKQERNRAYANGRMDAYAQMGIRALESRQAGTTMYYIKDTGEVIEDITASLEDVKAFDEKVQEYLEDEITIDDLVEA